MWCILALKYDTVSVQREAVTVSRRKFSDGTAPRSKASNQDNKPSITSRHKSLTTGERLLSITQVLSR